jgi:hypothetical protein
LSGNAAVAAERHRGYDVLAVRAKEVPVGFDGVVCLVEHGTLEADSQRQHRNCCDRQVQHHMQGFRQRDALHHAEAAEEHEGEGDGGRHDESVCRPRCARRPGEPQCRADQSADGRGGQRHRDTLDTRLNQESADRPVAGRRAGQ